MGGGDGGGEGGGGEGALAAGTVRVAVGVEVTVTPRVELREAVLAVVRLLAADSAAVIFGMAI